MENKKDRKWYLDNLQVGNIVAFKVGNIMLSGKVEGVEDDGVVIRTKNYSVYYIKKEGIVWVKNGSSWPLGIYNALKINNRKLGSNEEGRYRQSDG